MNCPYCEFGVSNLVEQKYSNERIEMTYYCRECGLKVYKIFELEGMYDDNDELIE